VVRLAEIDTSGYIGNSPGSALLTGEGEPGSWFELLARTSLQPDTPHRFRIADLRPVESVRLDVFPDGGVARLRLYGSLTPDGLAEIRRRWAQTAP
jgi:allantoicase